LGTFLLRSAGCICNDRADRRIDAQVTRTRQRPLAMQTLSVREADIFLGLLLFLALILLLQLPVKCYYEAAIALVLIFMYPFCKRFFRAPQVILSFAFSMSIPMVYSASGKAYDSSMTILWLLNCAWVIAYDTQYALVDKEDDLKIGIHSTAIFFGKYAQKIIGILQIIVHVLWFYLAACKHYSCIFYAAWFFSGVVLIYQQYLLKQASTKAYWQAFLSNGFYGGVLWVAQMIQ
jgi:4-hydroxybenzoate polyprenyltransferase